MNRRQRIGCLFILAVISVAGVVLMLSGRPVSLAVKSIDVYWTETGLKPNALDDLVDDDSCRSSQRYFLACANAIGAVADRMGLKLTKDGRLLRAKATLQESTEKSFLEPWRDFFDADYEAASRLSFRKAWRNLIQNHVAPERHAMITGAALNGFLSVFRDPHTYLIPAAYYQEVVARSNASTIALGVVVARGKTDYFLRKVIKGSPSDKAGLKRGDWVVSIDRIPLRSVPPQRLSELLRAEEGTATLLEIRRGERVFTVRVPREHNELPAVTWSVLDGLRPTGVLTIHKFARESCEMTKSALKEMNDKRLKGLLLDVRDNSGGQMEQASCVISLFVGPKKETFRINYLDPGKEPESYVGQEEKQWNGKVAVLINSGSASAAEIVAGSLRDQGRAILVGERTFGKGSFQEGEYWARNSKVAFFQTKGFYYLPSGFSPQLRGIDPDVNVASVEALPFREQDQYMNPLNPPRFGASLVMKSMDLGLCLDGDLEVNEDIQLSKARTALNCAGLAAGESHDSH